MHKPGKQPWRWLIILTTSLAIIFATIPASYKCLKCMNCGRRSLNDHEACCTWDKWPIQSHRPRSDYGNRPGVVKFVMIRNAHAENYEFVSFPEMRTSAITMTPFKWLFCGIFGGLFPGVTSQVCSVGGVQLKKNKYGFNPPKNTTK